MKSLSWVLIAMISFIGYQDAVAESREDAFLKELQAELEKRGNPWVAGKTSVSHLSSEEKERLCNLPLISRRERHPDKDRLSLPPKNPPPDSMDWRNYRGYNWMTPVKSQICDDAPAFATVGAFESRMKIFWGRPDTNPDLSERYLYLCGASDSLARLAEFMVDSGVPTEDWNDSFPVPESLIVKGANWGETSLDVDSIKHEIMNGPTAIHVDWKEGKNEGIREDFFYYKGGAYEPVAGEWIKTSHSVCLCGWDSAGNWLIKNSWGTGWGMGGASGGYGYISKVLDANVWVNPLCPLAGIVLARIWTSERKWSAGEQVDIIATLTSEQMNGANVKAVLSTADPYVTVDAGHGNFGDIPCWMSGCNSSDPFKLTASVSTPEPHFVQCSLHVSEDGGYSTVLPFTLSIGWMLCETEDSFDLPSTPGDTCMAYGMASDGVALYMTDWFSPYIYIFDRSGIFLGTIPAPEDSTHATGIDYDWENDCLWVTNSTTKMIYKVSPSDGSIFAAFASPAQGHPTGLAFDGTDLWVADRDTNTIYRVARDGSVLASFAIPMESNDMVRGLAFDSSAAQYQGEGTLIFFVTHWDSTFTHLDSCAIHEITRYGTLIPDHKCITPGNTTANGRVVCVDLETGDYWVDGGTEGPIYKIQEFNGWPGVEEERVSPRVSNLAVAPNPTRQGACVSFCLSAAARVEIKIYDVTGKLVSPLVNREFRAGPHQVRWHGTDLDGQKLPSGVYFCQIKTGQFKTARKLILLQ